MPDNEVGDRIHNFFGEENLSQGQHHSQVVDNTWPGISNNLWVGDQRRIGSPVISNLKNYNVQQTADPESGQATSVQHDLNLEQSTLRPEYFQSQAQNHQLNLNGYMHNNRFFPTNQNEANFLRVDTGSDQLENGVNLLRQENSMRLGSTESVVNYDFFGGQQQVTSQHSGMLQAVPRQQPGSSGMQLLQQQLMFKQMQEFQRHQELQKQQRQQQDARQPSINHTAVSTKQSASNHSPGLINGVPVHDTSSYSWQPELTAANMNWLQRGGSSHVQGSSGGLMCSPEQGQMRLMGSVPQKFEQSLYGVPVSSIIGTPNQYSSIQTDKPGLQQMSENRNSFQANQNGAFTGQVSMLDNNLPSFSRHGYQGDNMFGPAAAEGPNSEHNLGNLQQMNHLYGNSSMQKFSGKQEVASSSGTSQQKTLNQVTPSQNEITLDPTEEKILFGSNDSLWDAFGRASNMNSGGYNGSDSLDIGAFSSLQNGTWSALMQSAVAETFSGDTALQEEWSGVSVRNSEPLSGKKQTQILHQDGKQQCARADKNSHTLNSMPYFLSDNSNAPFSGSDVPGSRKQSGLKTSFEQSESTQTDHSLRLVQELQNRQNQWYEEHPLQKPVAESGQIYVNTSHSSSAEVSVKNDMGSRANQQTILACNSGVQPCIRPDSWDIHKSISPSGDMTMQNNGNTSQHKRVMHVEMGSVAGMWNSDPMSNGVVKGHTIVSPDIGRGSALNNVATVSKSSFLNTNQEPLSSSFNPNFLNNLDSSLSSRLVVSSGKQDQHMDKNSQNFESLGKKGLDKGAVDPREIENSARENSSDSFRSNASQNTSVGAFRENKLLDADNSRSGPSGKQKSSNNVGRRTPITRKFQYHPMGNLDADEEPSYGTKYALHPQSNSQQSYQGHFVKSKSTFHMAETSKEIEKGCSSGHQGESRHKDEVGSRRIHPVYAGTSISRHRPVGIYGPKKTTQSSENMLELLHKVDQLSEHDTATHFGSSDRSEKPEAESSDGSVGQLQPNKLSASQGFGLQLGPPSQRSAVPDYGLSSHSSSLVINSENLSHVMPDLGGKGHAWLVPTVSIQSVPPQDTSQGTSKISSPSNSGQINKEVLEDNIQENSSTFISGFSSRNMQSQPNPVNGADGRKHGLSFNLPFDRFAFQSKQTANSSDKCVENQLETLSLPDLPKYNIQSSNSNQNCWRDTAQQFSVLEAFQASQSSVPSATLHHGALSKSDALTSIQIQQGPPGSEPGRPTSLSRSYHQTNNNLEVHSPGKEKSNQSTQKGGYAPSEVGNSPENSQDRVEKDQPPKEQPQWLEQKTANSLANTLYVQGKEAATSNLFDISIPVPERTQRDIAVFGRTLKPNDALEQDYSLLHQAQFIRSTEIDPNNRNIKRFKGSNDAIDSHQVVPRGQQSSYGSIMDIKDISTDPTSVASGHSKALSFSLKHGDGHNGNPTSNELLVKGRDDSQNFAASNNSIAIRGDRSEISPQMAPSWFNQYGTFKNGELSPIYEGQRVVTRKTTHQPSVVEGHNLHARQSTKQVDTADASQLGYVPQSSIPMSNSSEPFSTTQLMGSDAADGAFVAVTVRPKKRKSDTSELLPWCKEVMQGSGKLQNISVAEVEWAQAVNRLAQKLEDEAELIPNGSAVHRSRRRLMLTTQLMQQLLHSLPAEALLSDASSSCESVTFFAGRAALGHACSTSYSASTSDRLRPFNNGNLLPEKDEIIKKSGDLYILKAIEDFLGRANKLERDLLRLDNGPSLIDLRMECQDIERFSVINRFAKFHGRRRADEAEISSSYVAPDLRYRHRFVAAIPMPSNLPHSVQCFSLDI